MIIPFDDAYFMRQALIEAEKAFHEGEVPVGAVVVANQQIIGRGHNLTEKLQDVTAHAEIQAITAAAIHIGANLVVCALAHYIGAKYPKFVSVRGMKNEAQQISAPPCFTKQPFLKPESLRMNVLSSSGVFLNKKDN
jgi:tRNA(Arg) A34 adenosine deaminase TadA